MDVVRDDLIKIALRVSEILERRNPSALKELSNHTIHNASIFQDEDSISIAVIIYALSKLLSSGKITEWEHFQECFARMKFHLLKKDELAYKKEVQNLFGLVTQHNENWRTYVDEVIRYAEIKKAARIYEHGISMARAAQMLGISEWDIAQSVGQTLQAEPISLSMRNRLSYTRTLFGVPGK